MDKPMTCVNENCRKPIPEYGAVVVNMDGDFACSPECFEEYKKQRDHFLNVILPDDKKFAGWLGVDAL